MKIPFNICFGLILTTTVCTAAGNGPGTKNLFQSQAVKRGPIPAVVSALGELQPVVTVEVGATVPGTIQELGTDPNNKPINFNSAVKVGTVLARIDPAAYAADVDRATADLQRTKAEVRVAQAKTVLAEKELLRIKKRQANKIADATDVEVATAAYELARLSIPSAETMVAQQLATLTRAELLLSNTAIRSPIDGVVIERRCHVGQTVAPGFNSPNLFLIASDLKKLQIHAFVLESDVRSIAPGQPVTFTVSAFPDRTFKGRVAAGQPRLNAALNKEKGAMAFTVMIETDNADRKLLPYLTARVSIQGVRQDALLVPKAALRWFPLPQQVVEKYRPVLNLLIQRPVVWVEDRGLVRPVVVKTGSTDGLLTEVIEGELTPGMRVVTGGS